MSQSVSFEVCWVADHVVANLRRHSTITTLSCCGRNDNKLFIINLTENILLSLLLYI